MSHPAPPRYLGIYLNDHLAGSKTAIELIERATREYAGTELGTFLAALGAEIQEDRERLVEIMRLNGVEPDRIKLALAWAAEKLARLKFNGYLLRRSPLTPFLELETLAIGIHGKRLLWRALRAGPADDAGAARLDELIARAERQLDDVERYRVEAGARAVTPARAR